MKFLPCIFLAATIAISSAADENRKLLALDAESLKIATSIEFEHTITEDGAAQITYTNTKLKGGELVITKNFDPPITINNSGFDLKPAAAETLMILWKFEDGRTMQLTLENPGAVWHEHFVDVAMLAQDRGRNDLGAISSMSIQLRLLKEAEPKTIELRNWWIE